MVCILLGPGAPKGQPINLNKSARRVGRADEAPEGTREREVGTGNAEYDNEMLKLTPLVKLNC